MTDLTTIVTPDDQRVASMASSKNNIPGSNSNSIETPLEAKRKWFLGRSISFAINDHSIEMAVVSSTLRNIKLIDAQKQYLSAKVDEKERWEFVCEAVADYLEEYSTSYSRVCVALAGPESSYRTFLMPQLKQKQLASAIVFEIKKQLPFPITDCNYGYRAMSVIPRGNQTNLKISLAAATKSFVKHIMTPVESAGYNIATVYNAPEAVGQLLRHLPDFEPDVNYAMICIDPDRTLLSYYRGSDLLFYNYTSLGSSIIRGRSDPERFDDFAQMLAAEVQNSLDYYAGQLSSSFSNRLYIHGDMAYSDELISNMKSHLGFEFCRFPSETLDFITDSQKISFNSLSTSLQALGAAACNHKIANLLPPDKIEANLIHTTKRIVTAGISIMTLVLMTIWAGLFYSNLEAESNLNEINKTIEQFQSSEIALELNRVKAELAAEQAYLSNTKDQNAYIGFNLKELSILTPEFIHFQLIEIDRRTPAKRTWRLVGTVKTSLKPHEIVLADYVEILKHSQFFSAVTLERYHKKAERNGFNLEFELLAESVL